MSDCAHGQQRDRRCVFCESGRPTSAWISVKDRLPEDRNQVLCANPYRVTTGWYDAIAKRWYEEYCEERLEGITHWQPLPEPPEDR